MTFTSTSHVETSAQAGEEEAESVADHSVQRSLHSPLSVCYSTCPRVSTMIAPFSEADWGWRKVSFLVSSCTDWRQSVPVSSQPEEILEALTAKSSRDCARLENSRSSGYNTVCQSDKKLVLVTHGSHEETLSGSSAPVMCIDPLDPWKLRLAALCSGLLATQCQPISSHSTQSQ